MRSLDWSREPSLSTVPLDAAGRHAAGAPGCQAQTGSATTITLSTSITTMHLGNTRIRLPEARNCSIDVSFAALKDLAELDCLNRLPTSFVLPAEAIDRLRALAGTIIAESPDFRRLVKDTLVAVVPAAARP